jgi:hypothetical protein
VSKGLFSSLIYKDEEPELDDDEDYHLTCSSWPNCDVVPEGCEFFGEEDDYED